MTITNDYRDPKDFDFNNIDTTKRVAEVPTTSDMTSAILGEIEDQQNKDKKKADELIADAITLQQDEVKEQSTRSAVRGVSNFNKYI